MGFAGAHRRSELVALTLADVTLHPTDGLHVRLRRSKTDQEARGTVKALPYGRDPVTCPPCAYVRWRQVLHAWDTADPDGAGRRAVLTGPPPAGRHHRGHQRGRGGQEEEPRCCTAAAAPGSPNRPDPGRALFPTVHETGAIGASRDVRDAIAEMIQRRAAAAGFTAPPRSTAVGRALAASRVCHRGVPGRRGRPRDHAADRTPLPGDARGLRPRTRPPGRQRRHPPRPLTPP